MSFDTPPPPHPPLTLWFLPSHSPPTSQELSIINYASNVLGSRGPRKMKVAVPKVLPDGRRVTFQPDHEEDSMIAKFKAGYIQDMFLLINKPPKWNDQVRTGEEGGWKQGCGGGDIARSFGARSHNPPPPSFPSSQVGAYVLNFNGRVTMASVKNFQLVSPDDHDTVVLQFGRTGKDTFTMDYRWPLSPLQAFSICISSFDYKLACE
jgi:tubby and related proteins